MVGVLTGTQISTYIDDTDKAISFSYFTSDLATKLTTKLPFYFGQQHFDFKCARYVTPRHEAFLNKIFWRHDFLKYLVIHNSQVK